MQVRKGTLVLVLLMSVVVVVAQPPTQQEPGGATRVDAVPVMFNPIGAMARAFGNMERAMAEATTMQPEVAGFGDQKVVKDDDKETVLAFFLPGASKNNINVSAQGNMAVVNVVEDTKEKEPGAFGESMSQMSRSFALPEGVKPTDISAHWKDGDTLEIHIPKPHKK